MRHGSPTGIVAPESLVCPRSLAHSPNFDCRSPIAWPIVHAMAFLFPAINVSTLPPPLRGALWMALAVPCFSIMINLVRYLSETQHTFEIVFFRNLFGVIALTPWMIRQGTGALRTNRLGLHMFRSGVGLAAMCLWFWTLDLMPTTEATAMSFLAPIMTSLLAIWLLGEPMRAYRLIAVCGGFLGTLIIIRPGSGVFVFGAIVAVLTALVWAISSVTVKKLSSTEPAPVMAVYMVLPIMPISLALAWPHWLWPTPAEWMAFLALGTAGSVGHVAMGKAMASADAGIVVAYDYLRLPCVALIAYLVFGDVTDGFTWLGAILIALCGLFVARRSIQEARA